MISQLTGRKEGLRPKCGIFWDVIVEQAVDQTTADCNLARNDIFAAWACLSNQANADCQKRIFRPKLEGRLTAQSGEQTANPGSKSQKTVHLPLTSGHGASLGGGGHGTRGQHPPEHGSTNQQMNAGKLLVSCCPATSSLSLFFTQSTSSWRTSGCVVQKDCCFMHLLGNKKCSIRVMGVH